MTIAVLAWGSLVWDPRSLRIQGRWHRDGPHLPVEFARVSKDGRLTLVIVPGMKPQRTLWAVTELDDFDRCRCSLADREGSALSRIHGINQAGEAYGEFSQDILDAVTEWLTQRRHLVRAAIWTGLPSNWEKKRGQTFTVDGAVRYLEGLPDDQREQAEKYIRRAPPQIRTPVREAVEVKLGWTPADATDE